jgi:hypothetical protein
MTHVTTYVEVNGKSYRVSFSDAGALAYVRTKTGSYRTLNGYGRAYRPAEAAAAVAAAKARLNAEAGR